MSEQFKYPDEERRMVQKVAMRAYHDEPNSRTVNSWVDECLRSKQYLRELFGGKLRINASEMDIEGTSDEEEDVESGDTEGLSDVIGRTVRDGFRGSSFDNLPLSEGWLSNGEVRAIMEKYEQASPHFEIKAVDQASRSYLAQESEELYDTRSHARIIKVAHNAVYNPEAGKVEVTTIPKLCFTKFLLLYLEELPEENIMENRTLSGMKINKYMKTFLPARGDIHDCFDTMWSRIVQQLKVSSDMSRLVLSVAPIDYLLHSEAMTWGSCHSLDGERGSAGWSFGHDYVTAVAYMERAGTMFDKFGIDYPDKSWRLLVHIDVEKGVVVTGIPYPHGNPMYHKILRTGLMRLLADYHKTSRSWWSSRDNMSDMRYGGLPYADMHHNSEKARLRLKEMEVDHKESNAYIGTEDVRCLSCGDWTENPEDPICTDCLDDTFICMHCDERISTEDSMWFRDEPYCGTCWSEHFFCCYECHETHSREDAVLVNTPWHASLVCLDCSFDYGMCNGCEEMFASSIMSNVLWNGGFEETWCDACTEDVVVRTCPDCDQIMLLDDKHEDMTYCDDCFTSKEGMYDNSNSLEINWENKEVG